MSPVSVNLFLNLVLAFVQGTFQQLNFSPHAALLLIELPGTDPASLHLPLHRGPSIASWSASGFRVRGHLNPQPVASFNFPPPRCPHTARCCCFRGHINLNPVPLSVVFRPPLVLTLHGAPYFPSLVAPS